MRNLLNLQVLTALLAGDRHAFGVIEQLKSDGVIEALAEQRHIYRVLKRLEADGLVKSEDESGRRIYRLTSAGRRQLRPALTQLQELAQHLRERI